QRMGRNYTRRAVKDLLAKICRQRPDMVFTADLIVGFPGESHRQFMATLELVRDLGLAGCHVFPFSPREGTVAATLDGQI
ncbi:MAG: tRNA (N(6)-L-threonylcarbamoyladenosine(37)-C(2))-methylthiotransferase MtaB, partial [Negativicutes bacterium]|nr:tRNA (N(6)-L-threonylcarbamoyladenosine(37)-C(2))-methylthiotransferase MtaB [Negativicutes bacterium]